MSKPDQAMIARWIMCADDAMDLAEARTGKPPTGAWAMYRAILFVAHPRVGRLVAAELAPVQP